MHSWPTSAAVRRYTLPPLRSLSSVCGGRSHRRRRSRSSMLRGCGPRRPSGRENVIHILKHEVQTSYGNTPKNGFFFAVEGNGRSIHDMRSRQKSRYQAVLRRLEGSVNTLEHYRSVIPVTLTPFAALEPPIRALAPRAKEETVLVSDGIREAQDYTSAADD